MKPVSFKPGAKDSIEILKANLDAATRVLDKEGEGKNLNELAKLKANLCT